MRTFSTRIIAAFTATLAGAVLAPADTVLSPAKRQQSLEQGRALVANREITAVAVDPFYSAAFAESSASSGRVTPGPVTPAPGGAETPRTPTGPKVGG